MVGFTQNIVWLARRKVTRLSRIPKEKFAVIVPLEWVRALYNIGYSDPIYVDVAILDDGKIIIKPVREEPELIENENK